MDRGWEGSPLVVLPHLFLFLLWFALLPSVLCVRFSFAFAPLRFLTLMCGFLGLEKLCNEVGAVEILLRLPRVILAEIKGDSLFPLLQPVAQASEGTPWTQGHGDATRALAVYTLSTALAVFWVP